MIESLSFGSAPSRLDPSSMQSWQEMQRIELLAKEMNVDFATAYAEYQRRSEQGTIAPLPPVTFAEQPRSTATVAFGELQIDTTDLSQNQLEDIAVINNIIQQENVSFEEAIKLYFDRNPAKY